MKRKWDFQFISNWWVSLGIHFDHTDPSVTIHLPGAILYFGNCKQPGFRGPNELEGELEHVRAFFLDTARKDHLKIDELEVELAELEGEIGRQAAVIRGFEI